MATAKKEVQRMLAKLPDDCSFEDIQYHIYVMEKIERGLADVAAGRTIPHEEVEARMREKWLLGDAE